MRRERIFARLVLALALMAAMPVLALAQSHAGTEHPMKLLKLTVSGNKQVPSVAIQQAMTVHVGETVTRSDLAANMNAIVEVYRHANVGAGFKQKMTIPRPGQVLVAYMIAEQAAPPPQAPAVLRLDKVTFEGNKKVTSEQIASVLTLKPGDAVDEAKVSANMQAVLALYKKANTGVKITPGASYPQPNHAVLDYKIEEGKSD